MKDQRRNIIYELKEYEYNEMYYKFLQLAIKDDYRTYSRTCLDI